MHDIQKIKTVYDLEKAIYSANNPLSDSEIITLLTRLDIKKELKENYPRFKKGYAAEDLFQCIYSLLPWVKNISSLGQEQYPKESKSYFQVPDFDITFENYDKKLLSVLIEVKLINTDKKTFELKTYQYDVLNNYAETQNKSLLFALYWKKHNMWTVNSIEAFNKKSSCYKISYEKACFNDLSAIFGDYSYYFNKNLYRKSIFSEEENISSEYIHKHLDFGLTVYDGFSFNNKEYTKLSMLETPLLDCAFSFKSISKKYDESTKQTELIEIMDKPLFYKLSTLLTAYLYKIYLVDYDTMFIKEHFILDESFNIIDTIRRKLGGEKYYALPKNNNATARKMIYFQFKKDSYIAKIYDEQNYKKHLFVKHIEK